MLQLQLIMIALSIAIKPFSWNLKVEKKNKKKLKMKKRWLAVFAAILFLILTVTGAIKILGPSISSEIHQATIIIQNYSTEKMSHHEDSQIATFLSEGGDKTAEND